MNEVRKPTKQIPVGVQTPYLLVTRLNLVVTESVLPAFEPRYVQMKFLLFIVPTRGSFTLTPYSLFVSLLLSDDNDDVHC